MASKYLQKYPVPQGFQEVLSDFTREVLRDQPTNIIEYAAKYFEMLERGEKFEFDSKFNVKKEDKKYELAYNPKNAQEITKRASNIAAKVGSHEPEAAAKEVQEPESQKTVNQQEVEGYMDQQADSVLEQEIDRVVNGIFDQLDSDRSGFLDKKEIKQMCDMILEQMNAGVSPSEQELQEVMDNLDANHDGKISRQQFLAFVKRAMFSQ